MLPKPVNSCRWIVTFAAVLLLRQAAVRAGGDGWSPAIAAAREVSSQIDSFQRAWGAIPQDPGGRGVYGQLNSIRIRMYQFRQTISQQQSKENIIIAFKALDGEVKQLLNDVNATNNPSVNYVLRRLSVAEADLQFAVTGPGDNPTQKSEALARQTLALSARAEELEGSVRYEFLNDASLPNWMAAIKSVRQAIADFKTAQEKNASAADLKAALVKVDQAWEKVVDRFVLLPDLTYVMIQTDAVQLDAVLGRIDGMVGVANRKGRLPTKLLQQ